MALTKVSTPAIKDEAITLAKLLHGDSNNDGKFLRANNGADPTFETVSTDLVADTSPQLGGNLDTNGFEIALDSDKAITFDGKGNIEYKSSQFQITNSTGDILIDNNSSGHDVQIYTDTNFEVYVDNGDDAIKAIKNGAVELYHNNSKKLETTADGIKLPDAGKISFNDVSYIWDNNTNNNTYWMNPSNSTYIDIANSSKEFAVTANGTSEAMIKAIPDAQVELYYDNSKKAETVSGGFTVSGTCTATAFSGDGQNLTGVMQADIDGLSWNTSNGVLTLQRHGLGNLTIDLDGRYPTGTIPTNNNQLSNGAGYMSGSTSQLCKAFVNYSGNNNSIRNDYNVSSITDHGTGDQTVNFSNSISMSYTVCGMPIAHDTGGTRCTNAIRGSSSSGPTRMNSTGVRINRGFGSHNAFADGHTMCVAIFRP